MRIIQKKLLKNQSTSKNLKKNHKIKKDDLVALRPRLQGVSPIDYKKIIGKRLKTSVKVESIFDFKKIK